MRLAHRLFAVLLSLVVLTSAFGRASVAWACEGRVCSSDASVCCCASSQDARHGSCLTTSTRGEGACKGRCACTAVVVKAATSATFQAPKAIYSVVLVDAAVAFLPRPIQLAQAFIRLEIPQLRAIPPPEGLPDPPSIEHASLRAPPATA